MLKLKMLTKYLFLNTAKIIIFLGLLYIYLDKLFIVQNLRVFEI